MAGIGLAPATDVTPTKLARPAVKLAIASRTRPFTCRPSMPVQ